MLNNWHQMDGNWLETMKHTYIARMRFLPFSWFSMKLGMINSFPIVCFTVVQKIFKLENIYKIHTKISCNGYKTMLRGKCITFTINTRENLPIIFPAILID